jgi:hypothetical protein
MPANIMPISALPAGETLTDPVGKLRTSTPQSLIDTDFEYSTQSTKWESINLLSNRPSTYYDSTAPLTITAVAGAGTRVVTVTTASPPAVGTPVFIQGTTAAAANGWHVVDTVSAGVSFTYTARTTIVSASIYDATKTYVFAGNFYSGSAIPTATGAFTASTTTVTCTTTAAHGLNPGDAIYVVGTTAATSGPPNGSWIVATTPTSNTFTFSVITAPSGAITGVLNASLYPRAYGSVVHRSFDGGVEFSAGLPYPGNQLIRQTRRYFRYQSGKGIQFSTGTIMKPALSVDSLTSSGTTVTVTVKGSHNLGVGAFVKVSGANETAYNGTFAVASIPTESTFTYTAASTPSATPATGFPINVNVDSWYGSKNRCGMFDEQNGFFFEYDGQALYAVKRSSTTQISGVVAVNTGAATITGTGTYFSSQLTVGDYITIRGQSYTVLSIISDTSLVISPEYRGTSNISNCIVSKRIEERAAQSEWNLDKCDGTTAESLVLDLSKMQMFIIDYSWYGAGSIRFGLKDNFGNIRYVHRIVNSNRNTEAYMRSGNLPARYETNTIPIFTILSATLASSGTSMTVASTTGFPSAGTLCITASGNTGAAIEYVTYTGKTTTTFTGLTRGVVNLTGPGGFTGGGGAAATTFTVAAGAPISVNLFSPQYGANLSHWGSAAIMDGRYDNDREFVFQAGLSSALANVAATGSVVLMALRLAPSVDSGITGLLGARDLINRMQLQLRQMAVLSTGVGVAFRVDLVLNGRITGGTTTGFQAVGGSSLAQVALYTAGGAHTAGTGETIYSFFSAATSDVFDVGSVRDLGNSILGGGLVNTVASGAANLYPDGPDVVLVKATNISTQAVNSIVARLAWSEAQA